MDWASAEAHKDKLAEWGLDGEPECRVNPFNAHRGVGGCTAQTDAMEPDAMQRLPAALLDMVRRGDGTITPGVGISAEQLPPRPPSPPARPPAHRGSQLHHAEWREIRETWKKILDGHPRYKVRACLCRSAVQNYLVPLCRRTQARVTACVRAEHHRHARHHEWRGGPRGWPQAPRVALWAARRRSGAPSSPLPA